MSSLTGWAQALWSLALQRLPSPPRRTPRRSPSVAQREGQKLAPKAYGLWNLDIFKGVVNAETSGVAGQSPSESAFPTHASRHAYLITAYNNFEVVENLLRSIDDSRNDIYIHIDGSVKDFDSTELRQNCKISTVTFVPRVNVHWGHYSQIQSVFNLLQEATKTPHSYYHLLSGTDLPIKSQDHIHEFCQKHQGKEFVGFSGDDFSFRVKLFYFFNRYRRPVSRMQQLALHLFTWAGKLSFTLQRKLGIDRSRSFDVEIKKGSDWFSISHELASYLLARRKTIRDLFRFAEIPTEFYVQTMVWNSPFRARVFDPNDEFASSLRLVDWARGNPYVFRRSDLPELLGSNRLFARKFLSEIDGDVVEDIRRHVSG
jgi:hypothetical protein